MIELHLHYSFVSQTLDFVFLVDSYLSLTYFYQDTDSFLFDIYLIDSGLEAGEDFVLEGVQKVKEDQKIKAEFQDPKKVLQSLKLKAD